MLAKSLDDGYLCPVMSLLVFLNKTNKPAFLLGRTQLFLPLDEINVGDLLAHRHKLQIIATIEEVYAAMDLRLASDFKLRMHDTRMLAFSVASTSGVTLDSILS
eukprot:GHVR01115896.1.p2 GENE.GHVR01115896.1~~GHVR01115896.1.p2  ORF type:complete len:104 (-),score=4.86 GHVR01115896.1:165-476(-)